MSSSILVPSPSPLTGVKRALYRSAMIRYVYARARSPFVQLRSASVFDDPRQFARALYKKADGRLVLRTHDGLQIAVRQNRWDAEIVREIFLDQPYTRQTRIGAAPVVVDIGGYIGDFTLYALKYLDAARVVVCEPTLENFQLLRHNVELNGYDDRVVALNAAVGPPGDLTLFVHKASADEIHASSYWYGEHEHRTVPSLSLTQLLDDHDVDRVDLLKVDCEGGEYDIFADTDNHTLKRIETLVFEYHEVDDFRPKLEHLLARLQAAGFALHRSGHIISAHRP